MQITLATGLFLLATLAFSLIGRGQATPAAPPVISPTAAEAKIRSQLLHATIEGSLQVMHRDFFRKNDSKVIPSASLVDVFKSLSDEFGVQLHWLSPAETIMNVDHAARDEFQIRALNSIGEGEKHVTVVTKGKFRYIGRISLQNQCLKCHVPGRTSLEDRFSALEISMPVRE